MDTTSLANTAQTRMEHARSAAHGRSDVTWLPRPTTQMTCRTGSHLAATGKPSQDGERRCVCDAGPTAPIP
jgi:hypothetical protein